MDSGVLNILVCGNVRGKMGTLYKKIASIEKKVGPSVGKFEMLLCVGDFFGANADELDKYVKGELTAPIMTYVVSPVTTQIEKNYVKDLDGNDICKNIVYLGHHGVYNLSNDLKIAYISGSGAATSADSANGLTFNETDITEVAHQVHADDSDFIGIDLLLTSCWPKHVQAPDDGKGEALISRLAAQVKPRYHFSQGEYFERPPYRNHRVGVDKDRHVTRFVSLANVEKNSKIKFIYALKLKPLKSMVHTDLVAQPAGVTEFPYREVLDQARAEAAATNEDSQFFWQKSSPQKRRPQDDNGDEPKKPRVYEPCWFCLGNPKVERHLVVSVGEFAYLALPRGGLVDDHVLIMPVEHQQSWVTCPDEVCREIESYKKALTQMYRKENKVPIVFERNFKSHHLTIQVVPIPVELAGFVHPTFFRMAKKQEPPLIFHISKTEEDLKEILAPHLPYMSIELPQGTRLFTRILKSQLQTFPLQFGRAVLASADLLDCTDREDWRECTVAHEEEEKLAMQFRQSFAPYDFTIQQN